MNHKDAKHFTWDQRLTLERMLKKGFTKTAIAALWASVSGPSTMKSTGASASSKPPNMSLLRFTARKWQSENTGIFSKKKAGDLKIGKDHALVQRLEELVMVQGFAPGAALAEIRHQR